MNQSFHKRQRNAQVELIGRRGWKEERGCVMRAGEQDREIAELEPLSVLWPVGLRMPPASDSGVLRAAVLCIEVKMDKSFIITI
ncbi:hypothetical protein V6N11_082252 [Hibiscus sabdariffa]|uniref:Uncharacterized protein n=1 Tax=Hibiscus sabdariffa TaxID=183260 RepID=A0ABR2QHN6_9ROSI